MVRWNPRANSLFLQVLELTDLASREAFLDRSCEGDDLLRAEVLRLLEASGRADDFLESTSNRVWDDIGAWEQPAEVGDCIGPYRLVQRIGEGGMGVVFKAEQTEPVRRTVALKVIRPDIATRQVLARFEAERQALALMDHPHIAKVLDAGCTSVSRTIPITCDRDTTDDSCPTIDSTPSIGDGLPYFVMELVEGLPITDFCDQNRLSISQRLRLFIPVCEAVRHAHQKGIIHRDLKPSNVLITWKDGASVPKIIDFGVAKAVGLKLTNRTFVTEYGSVLGTMEYMSPEQAELNQLDVDTRSDIYALGVMLYELLTGTTPLERSWNHKVSMLEALRNIREVEPSRPSVRLNTSDSLPELAARRGTEPRKLRRQVQGELEWIVMKALEKDRGRRYQSVHDFFRDIENHLADRPILARPSGTLSKVGRWCRRNRSVAVLLGAVALLILFSAVGASIAAIRLQRETATARTAETAARAAEAQARRAEKQAATAETARRHELVTAHIAEARAPSLAGSGSQREAGIRAIRAALAAVPWKELTEMQQLDVVNATIPWLVSSELQEQYRMPLEVYETSRQLHSCDIDPRFERLAYARPGLPTIVVEQLSTHDRADLRLPEQEPIIDGPYLRFSPSGRWLLVLYSVPNARRLKMWDTTTGAITAGPNGYFLNHWCSMDSEEQYLLFEANDSRTLHKCRIATAEVVEVSPPRFRSTWPAISPDGNYLAIASESLTPEIVDAKTWDTIATLSNVGRATFAAWHPHERRAYFGMYDGKIYQWCADRPRELELLGHEHDTRVVLEISPNGRLLASTDENNRFVVRRLSDNHILTRGTGIVKRFSAAGDRIGVVIGNQFVVYKLRESAVYHQIREVSGQLGTGKEIANRDDTAEYSPNGRFLALSGPRGVRLFDAQSLQPVADFGLDQCGPVAFHPNGDSITTYGCFSHAWNWPITDTTVGPPTPVLPGAYSTRWLAPQHGGRQAVWSRNGGRLALTDHRFHKLWIWEATTKAPREFTSVVNPCHVALSADGKWLAAQTGEYRTIVWNVDTGKEVLNVRGHMGMSISPDGEWFANRGVTAVELYRAPSWDCQRLLPIISSVNQERLPPVFQPEGTLLAVSDLEQRIHLYDRDTGTKIATLDDRDSHPITWLAFSPAGDRLAVTRADRTAVWNLAELSVELNSLGLQIQGLTDVLSKASHDVRGGVTETSVATTLQVDRGGLEPADRWYRFWQQLASHEAAEGNWPDAIDDMNRSFYQLPEDRLVQAAFFAQRGTYLQHNLSFQAAVDDWEHAIKLSSSQPTATIGLACTFVMGLPELRDPGRSISLATMLTYSNETIAIGQLLQAMARVRLHQSTSSDRNTLEAACSSDSNLSDVDWRIAAGYFLAIHETKNGNVPQSESAYRKATELLSEHESSLHLDKRQELDRLKMESQESKM